jgi:hypothetical protein
VTPVIDKEIELRPGKQAHAALPHAGSSIVRLALNSNASIFTKQ